LQRIFSLAMNDGKLLYRPKVPMLKENNVRTGFFEREQLEPFGSTYRSIFGLSSRSCI